MKFSIKYSEQKRIHSFIQMYNKHKDDLEY